MQPESNRNRRLSLRWTVCLLILLALTALGFGSFLTWLRRPPLPGALDLGVTEIQALRQGVFSPDATEIFSPMGGWMAFSLRGPLRPPFNVTTKWEPVYEQAYQRLRQSGYPELRAWTEDGMLWALFENRPESDQSQTSGTLEMVFTSQEGEKFWRREIHTAQSTVYNFDPATNSYSWIDGTPEDWRVATLDLSNGRISEVPGPQDSPPIKPTGLSPGDAPVRGFGHYYWPVRDEAGGLRLYKGWTAFGFLAWEAREYRLDAKTRRWQETPHLVGRITPVIWNRIPEEPTLTIRAQAFHYPQAALCERAFEVITGESRRHPWDSGEPRGHGVRAMAWSLLRPILGPACGYPAEQMHIQVVDDETGETLVDFVMKNPPTD